MKNRNKRCGGGGVEERVGQMRENRRKIKRGGDTEEEKRQHQ